MFCLCLDIAHLAHASRNCNYLIFLCSVTFSNIVVLRQCHIAHPHMQTCKSGMQDVHKIQLTKLST